MKAPTLDNKIQNLVQKSPKGLFIKTTLEILGIFKEKGINMKFFKICILISLLVTPSLIYANPSLTILSYSYFSDEDADSRPGEQYYNFFQPILNTYFNTVLTRTNHARLIKRLSTNEAVCSFNLIKTKARNKQLVFSQIPTYMHQQRKLFGFKNTLKDLPTKVSISKLLNNKHTFAIVSSTSYQQLDVIFSDYRTQVAKITGANSFAQLSQLLIHKRVDMIIDYENTMKMNLTDTQFSQLESRDISEYPEFINGYFACSKTSEGKKAIALIDNYMKTPAAYDFLKQTHHNSTSPEVAERMMAIYKTTFNIAQHK
ncbi:hypothetical protein NRL14_02280 [Pseudoalteromonas sp. 20-92]|uniref:hypothetical protein n=1 Tax=Pseudoalteromonas sp. 20-92 TaxID=2969394 RepID=UPI0027AE57A0|nr:hypothetical protein [Pseudoalteromonas sp. 20-92]MDQ2042554.1 hypothetical protein [Pseudoalteromonas sp. 20-92]